MRLKHYVVAIACLYVFPSIISSSLSNIYAEDNGSEVANEVPFECDENSLPEGLCAELSEEFASNGLWKTENQQALSCITSNCRPGLDSAFSSCIGVGFGQRCEGVEISEQDPQVWSSAIQADSVNGLSSSEHHKHLVVRALGFSKMVSYLAKEAIHNSNEDFDAARGIYSDESLKRQIDEAEQQGFYDNINFREVSRKAVCDDPHYKGDVQRYLYDEFYMDERYLTAINVAGNGFGEILDGGNNAKKVFSKGAINDSGRLRSGKLCRSDSDAFTLPSDELLETVTVQTDSMRSRGLIDAVGKVTKDGKKALKTADDFADNLAVQCKIQESQVEYILGAASNNTRFMKTASQINYCADLGRKGCSLPSLNSVGESCKTSYENSMDDYLSNYMDSSEFDRDNYIDPTTGRLKTNTKELLRKQLVLDREKQYSEAESDSDSLANVIEIKARFSAIMDLLKAEIGNNGWFFKSGQTIMSANGGRELNDEDVAKIKKLPVVGDVKAEVAYGNANSNNRWDGGNKNSSSRAYRPTKTSQDSPSIQRRLAGLPKHSSNVDEVEDYASINLDSGNSNSRYGNYNRGDKSSEDLVSNNPVYTDKDDRNNLLKFPDEIMHSGALSQYRTGVGFCTPSMIFPIDQDPNCRCVKGALLRSVDSESLDQVFEPCPGDEDYEPEY